MSSGAQRRKFIHHIGWCHICGLPIPESIVDQRNPLFGTVDHVIPRAAGGGGGDNRAPAHNLCNRMKSGSPTTNKLRRDCSSAIKAMLRKIIVDIPSDEVVMLRTGVTPRPFGRRLFPNSPFLYRTRWEDDGGYSQ